MIHTQQVWVLVMKGPVSGNTAARPQSESLVTNFRNEVARARSPHKPNSPPLSDGVY